MLKANNHKSVKSYCETKFERGAFKFLIGLSPATYLQIYLTQLGRYFKAYEVH